MITNPDFFKNNKSVRYFLASKTELMQLKSNKMSASFFYQRVVYPTLFSVSTLTSFEFKHTASSARDEGKWSQRGKQQLTRAESINDAGSSSRGAKSVYCLRDRINRTEDAC